MSQSIKKEGASARARTPALVAGSDADKVASTKDNLHGEAQPVNGMRTNGELILSGPKFQNQQAEFSEILGNGAEGTEELAIKLQKADAAKVYAQLWFDLSESDAVITNSAQEDEGQIGEVFCFHLKAPGDQHVGIQLNFSQAFALRNVLEQYIAAVDAVMLLQRDEEVRLGD